MATPQTAPGPVPKAGPGLVGINLTTAGHLADALDRVAVEVEGQAREARSAALEGGAVPIAAARLALVARWAAREAAAIRRIIERLRAVDVTGVARWSGGRSPAFADPVAGYAWGVELVDALLAGRMADARRLLADHGRDPWWPRSWSRASAPRARWISSGRPSWGGPGPGPTPTTSARSCSGSPASSPAPNGAGRPISRSVIWLTPPAESRSPSARSPSSSPAGPDSRARSCGMPSGRWSRRSTPPSGPSPVSASGHG